MIEKTIYTLQSTYREPMEIKGFSFGSGEPSVCIIGSVRGNEYSQIFACSRLVQVFKDLESKGKIKPGHEILIIPTLNSYSMNVFKRFWTTDNTDINRMFPGYTEGETTQRIAGEVFNYIKKYKYGIQFASFYLNVDFVPHVRMMRTGYEECDLALSFGLPYAVIRQPKPYDTTTLNYNWQVFESIAFSVYTSTTETIDESTIALSRDSVLRFLKSQDIIDMQIYDGYATQLIQDDAVLSVHCKRGGLFKGSFKAGSTVKNGDLLAEIFDPLNGEVKESIIAPCDGTLFFIYNKILINGDTVAFKICTDPFPAPLMS